VRREKSEIDFEQFRENGRNLAKTSDFTPQLNKIRKKLLTGGFYCVINAEHISGSA
jgi:hypothetical protein